MTISNKFGSFHLRNFGAGQQVKALPQHQLTRMDDFRLGLNMADDPEGIPKQSMAVAIDLEINSQGRMLRAPGTTLLGTYGTTYEPKQILSATTTLNTQKAILFDRVGNVGHKHGNTETVWQSLGLGPLYWGYRFTGVSFGDQFIFSNGLLVWSFDFSGNLFSEPTIPPFKSAAVIEGRLYIAYGTTIRWSGVSGNFIYKDFSSITSGGEDLISNESTQTDIIALRAMHNDYLAVLSRNSIWVGVSTGNPTRPLDFQEKIKGTGCVAEATAVVIELGVAYLAVDGVRVFDGNTSQVMSLTINKELLPLNLKQSGDDGIKQYVASYNPDAKCYYLHKGDCTYVFYINFVRWFKRSLVCYGGIQLYNALSDSTTPFIFLGLSGLNTNLEYEDYASLKYFGSAFLPTYEGPTSIDPDSKVLKMVDEIRITYSGYGNIQIYLQNQERVYEAASPVVSLTLSTDLREEVITFTHTGELLGLKFVILNGKLEIAALEMAWIPLGPNLSGQIRTCHFEQAADSSFFITDQPGPAYGWFLDTSVSPNEIVFDSTLTGPTFAVVGYDNDGSPYIEV